MGVVLVLSPRSGYAYSLDLMEDGVDDDGPQEEPGTGVVMVGEVAGPLPELCEGGEGTAADGNYPATPGADGLRPCRVSDGVGVRVRSVPH